MTTRSSTHNVATTGIRSRHTRTRRRALPRLGALALVTFLVAMALLPLSSPGVAAEEDEPAIVEIVPIGEVELGVDPDPLGEPEINPDALEEIPDLVIEASPEIVPDALDEISDVELPGDPAPGDVTVFKYDCPAGIDLEFVSQEELFAECTAVLEGVVFHLATEFEDRVEITNASGEAYWADVPMGAFDLIEEVPAGYSDPLVYCGWGTITDGVAIDGVVPLQLAPGGYVSLVTEYPGITMGCFWFNIPLGDDDGEVTVIKYDCLEGTDPTNTDLGYLEVQCTTKMNGVGFHLSASDGYEVSATTGDAGDGNAEWTDVPAGPITLTETIPAGYGDPIVFCFIVPEGGAELIEAVDDGDGGEIEPVVEVEILDEPVDGPAPTDSTGGVVNQELPAGSRLICVWLNIPLDDDGSITVYKHTCPPGYDLNAVGADPEVDCPSLTNGVAFSLWHGFNPVGEGVTGDAGDGMVFFSGLGTGDYYLVESIPAGIVALFVECTSAVPSDDPMLGPALAYFQPDVIDGGIDLSLLSGEEIVCHWYNVPADEPDGGELIVYKFWCDGHIYTIEACELYGGGAEFGLQATSGEGDPIVFNTGADGIEVLYLPATTWSLWEIDREWCRAESDDVDAEGNIVVSDGHTAEVYVFNCGPDGKKEPPVTDLPNTGSGTTTGPEGDPIILHGPGILLGLLQLTAASFISLRAMGLSPDLILGAARAVIRA
ncbi:MAG: MSCRAMM family protein [Thermomicrobiales bacterium]